MNVLDISHKYKFIFIQIPKTGSSSIKSLLRPFVQNGYSDVRRHADYSEIARYYPNESIEYFKFAFTRNPWDRLLSFYFFRKKRGRIVNKLTFKDFLLTSGGLVRKPQYDFIHQLNNYSFVGKFENLQQDFNTVCDKIEIPRQQLPHKNKTKHKHYTEYYDEETKQIVAQKYAKDIEYLGYEFGQ